MKKLRVDSWKSLRCVYLYLIGQDAWHDDRLLQLSRLARAEGGTIALDHQVLSEVEDDDHDVTLFLVEKMVDNT